MTGEVDVDLAAATIDSSVEMIVAVSGGLILELREARAKLAALVAAVAPLMDERVQPFYSAWEFDPYSGKGEVDGEALHSALKAAYEATP